MMSMPRYAARDPYAIEELRRQYLTSDARGRIKLLKNLQRDGNGLLAELASLAAEDSHTEVRQWLARDGQYFEESIESRLRNDPDPFVRACLRENPTVFGSISFITKWNQWFQEATHLERLALMRNPGVATSLVEKIFDPDDKELGIDAQSRRELALAFLTNKDKLDKEALAAGLLPGHSPSFDGSTWYGATKFLEKLWELAAKWPTESHAPYLVYKHVPVPDETKARTYETCQSHILRFAILESSSGSDHKTIELGMNHKQDDETIYNCRALAYSKVYPLYLKNLQQLLMSEDKVALSGLAENRNLPVEALEKVAHRLTELGDDLGAELARHTITQVEKTHPPEDPDELFGWEGREADYLEDKVDFIGKRLVSLQEVVAEDLGTIEKELTRVSSVISALVVWGGWVLFLVAVVYAIRFFVNLL